MWTILRRNTVRLSFSGKSSLRLPTAVRVYLSLSTPQRTGGNRQSAQSFSPFQSSIQSLKTMAEGVTMPDFATQVVAVMRDLFPESLADKSFDNTGLLLGRSPLAATIKADTPTVLLTNDLTTAVAKEAISKQAQIIVCYHPVIFPSLKSLSHEDPTSMQATLLDLAASGIAVYCPHTAVDAAPKGLNTWLCGLMASPSEIQKIEVCQPVPGVAPQGFEGSGYGRSMTIKPNSLQTVLGRLARGLGSVRYLSIALPESFTDCESTMISTVAVCAGSGSSVLRNSKAQLLVTGEMSHHQALRYTEQGQIVVTVFHSNSERQFLRDCLQPTLETALKDKNVIGARVLVSERDRDPFRVVDVLGENA